MKGRNYWKSFRRLEVYGLRGVCWMIVCVLSDLTWLPLLGGGRKSPYIIIITLTLEQWMNYAVSKKLLVRKFTMLQGIATLGKIGSIYLFVLPWRDFMSCLLSCSTHPLLCLPFCVWFFICFHSYCSNAQGLRTALVHEGQIFYRYNKCNMLFFAR